MLQSLKTFSALCLGLVMQAALGQPANFQHFGNFQRMMHTGDTAGQVALSKLDQSPGRWGVGALAGLKGEIIQVDGKLLVSLGTDTTGKVEAPKAGAEAVLWASDSVTQWKEISVPGDMSQAQFENFVSDQAAAIGLDLNQPLVFRVTGGYSHLIWHVLTGEMLESGGTGYADQYNIRSGATLWLPVR